MSAQWISFLIVIIQRRKTRRAREQQAACCFRVERLPWAKRVESHTHTHTSDAEREEETTTTLMHEPKRIFFSFQRFFLNPPLECIISQRPFHYNETERRNNNNNKDKEKVKVHPHIAAGRLAVWFFPRVVCVYIHYPWQWPSFGFYSQTKM